MSEGQYNELSSQWGEEGIPKPKTQNKLEQWKVIWGEVQKKYKEQIMGNKVGPNNSFA